MIYRVVLLLTVAFAMFGCSGGDAPTDVTEIQKEANKDVPKDLGTVSPDKAQEGMQSMGGAKGK